MEIGIIIRDTDEVYVNLPMEINLMESGLMMRQGVEVHTITVMEISIQENYEMG